MQKITRVTHKAGFVSIIGYPNAGKSTLLNKLLGEKLSIVTAKEQTTRHRILGILSDDNYQIVFSDTPGILEPKYKLQESMMKVVKSALGDADHILLLIDISKDQSFDDDLLNKLKKKSRDLTVLLNKLDLVGKDEALKRHEHWTSEFPEAEVFMISALHKHGLRGVLDSILTRLPESPAYYPKDQITDKSERFIVSEMVRKQLYEKTAREVPYSTEVVVNSFKENEDIIKISCDIFVSRDSQKSIVIGSEGKKIKSIGTAARQEMELFFGKKIFLELFVKVDKDWKMKEEKIKKYGYLN